MHVVRPTLSPFLAPPLAGRLGRRVVHFANLPVKLLMPSKLENITEIAIKTILSASKIEIKRVLESLYGFEVDNVRTLNMEGKKKKRGGITFAKPDYKKAYVTLRRPLSLPSNLYPIRLLEEERTMSNKQSKSSIVNEQEARTHWLDGTEGGGAKVETMKPKDGGQEADSKKFPWSYIPSWKQI